MGRKFSVEEAKHYGDSAGASWDGFTPEDLAEGMNVELEHQDVTGGDPDATARIALAHLKERGNYYRRLRRFVEASMSVLNPFGEGRVEEQISKALVPDVEKADEGYAPKFTFIKQSSGRWKIHDMNTGAELGHMQQFYHEDKTPYTHSFSGTLHGEGFGPVAREHLYGALHEIDARRAKATEPDVEKGRRKPRQFDPSQYSTADQIGTTQSGKPIFGPNHPSYLEGHRLPKWNADIGPGHHGGAGDSSLRRLGQRASGFVGWSRQDHADAAAAHEAIADKLKAEGQASVTAALKEHGQGRMYPRYAGGTDDNFPPEVNERHRHAFYGASHHRDVADFHRAQTKYRRDLKSMEDEMDVRKCEADVQKGIDKPSGTNYGTDTRHLLSDKFDDAGAQSRKETFENHNSQYDSVDYNSLSDKQKQALASHPHHFADESDEGFEQKFAPSAHGGHMEHVVHHPAHGTFYINNEGHDYARYKTRITNYPLKGHAWKAQEPDVLKAKVLDPFGVDNGVGAKLQRALTPVAKAAADPEPVEKGESVPPVPHHDQWGFMGSLRELGSHSLSGKQQGTLFAHARDEIAKRAGVSKHQAHNALRGRMGRHFGDNLTFHPEYHHTGDDEPTDGLTSVGQGKRVITGILNGEGDSANRGREHFIVSEARRADYHPSNFRDD